MRKFAILMAVLMAVMAVSAEVTCLFEGATMKVLAPASNAGAHIVLLWDATDKGDDPAAWANSHEIAAAVPADGAQYAVDLSSLGIKNETPCRIAVYNRYRLLDKLQMTSTQCYIDTGFKDTNVYGVRFGFYGNSGNDSAGWNFIIGTHEGSSASNRGFVVGQNSTNFDSWYWTYREYRSVNDSNDRPTVSNSSINEAAFTNRVFTLNGSVVKSDLAAGSVGVRGVNIFLGRAQYHNSRYHYGWWSHVSFDDADGNKILDYIPVQRGDGVVGFWNRVTDKFVKSTGSGAFTAGTVTNEGFEVVSSMQRVTPNLLIGLEMSGSRLYVNVPSGLAGEQLLLVWDDADKGNDVDAWANSREIAAAVGANGGKYCTDLARLGVQNGQTCRVFSRHNLRLLDKLEMPNSTTYINTGIKDSSCYGIRFGFYGTGISEGFGQFIGTSDAGFTIGANNTDITSWYWCCQGKKDNVAAPTGWGSSRPTVSTSSINDVAFTNQKFTVNGTIVKSELGAGVLGSTAANMHLGRNVEGLNRYHYGWWSYVRFDAEGGIAILDYIPAQRIADGKVGFLDRATGRFIVSTGGGAFNAGDVTNASWTAVHSSAATVVGGVPFLDIAIDGTSLTVTAPAGLAGEQLVLLWDDSDKGGDPSAWANSRVLAVSLPASGGTYSARLTTLGIGREHVCRVATVNQVQLLDKLQMTSTQCYIDTGFKDTDVYGVRFGFYGNSGNNSDGWNFIIGTHEGYSDSDRGFVVGQNGANFDSWYWTYRGYRSVNDRPTVSNSSINEAAFTNRVFTLNGSVVKSDLAAGSVGVRGVNIFLGRDQYTHSRCHYGWWSHVSFDDEAGNAILDYIPAQRVADGKVGFLDRATGRFIGSTGSGNFTSGSVTNESFSAEHLWRTVPLRGVAFPGMYIIVR